VSHTLRIAQLLIRGKSSPILHPFIAILAHAKGKKAIPRVFRHLEEEQRLTVITMIVVHLDQLDVIAHALPSADPSTPTPLAVREEVDLFAQVVMPSLFSYVNDAALNIINGLLGLIVERTTVPAIVRTKVGVSILTMLISRAELLRQATSAVDAGEWDQWVLLYNRLFDATEPSLPQLFPGTVVEADDVHVWQFLAAMGAAASPEQQQRLVIGVKERVMETVGVSRTLPRELGEQRLGHVNLFMRAIGLDVELLG
jgi:DNA topoisomerase 2-associated protein PAT1